VRANRYPYRGQAPGLDDYEKLDVEDVYLPRGATVLRLPMVYGERDYQRREEFVLRRIRAGRERMPFGAGQWLTCRVYVRDAGRAVRLALNHDDVAGEVMNVCEDRTYSMAMWTRMILDAAASKLELVRVADSALPEDLKFTGAMSQHILASASKARSVLGWTTSDAMETLRPTVRWHLDHPPEDASDDFTDDERALEAVSPTA
jgi:nucleoside-diphosphate-sugar epimerase